MIAERKAAFSAKFREFKSHKKDVQKKIFLSGVLGAATFATVWGGMSTFVLKEAQWVDKWMPGSFDTALALGISYTTQTAASLINLNQEKRLLKNPKIRMNQNFPATVVFHGSEVVKPSKEEDKGKRSIAAILTPTIPFAVFSLVREPTLISLALLSPDTIRELALFKTGQTIFSLLQAGVGEVALRTIGREEKVEEPVKEKVLSSGLVFEAPSVAAGD